MTMTTTKSRAAIETYRSLRAATSHVRTADEHATLYLESAPDKPFAGHRAWSLDMYQTHQALAVGALLDALRRLLA